MTSRSDLLRSPLLRTLAACLFALAFSFSAVADDSEAQKPADEEMESLGYQEQVDRFLAGVENGEPGAAGDQLYKGNPWMKPEDLEQVRKQFEGLPEVIGELHGYEKLSEQHVSDRFVFLWYVGYFDRSPISLYFKFYKPEDTWRFYSFEYKEDLGQIAKEAALDEVMDALEDRSDDD